MLIFILVQTASSFASDQQLDNNQVLEKHLSKLSASIVDTISDSICGAGEFYLCDGVIDFVNVFLSKNDFLVRRLLAPPYTPSQVIPVDVMSFETIGITDNYGDVPINLSTTYPSSGTITVNSVDGLGNLKAGMVSLDLYLDFLCFDSILLHNDEPLDISAEFTSKDHSHFFLFDDGSGSEALYDSNGFMWQTICSYFMEAYWSACCNGSAGDLNGDSADANILDLTFAVDRIFRGGQPTICLEEGDPNGDGSSVNILDLTFLVDRIFRGGSAPVHCSSFSICPN